MPVTPRHLNRYRQIAEIMIGHGFGALLSQIGLDSRLNLPRRLLRRRPHDAAGLSVAEHVRLALEELGPTFVKLGQILSTRPDLLPPTFLIELSRLQDDVPPAEWDLVKAVIESELGGSLEELFISFDSTPLAAASLAQVHQATLPGGEKVVVKVQRPGIRRTIDLDLDILHDIARMTQDRVPWAELYDLPELAEEFALQLRAELDYRREGHNADRFRANFKKERHILVPTVYWDYTTSRVLVQEFISGIKINDITGLDEAGYNRHQIAVYSARFIVQEILEDGFFHADPHPGNIVVMPGEIIGMMDFGTVGHLDPTDRAALIRLYVTAVRMDTVSLVDQLIQVGVASPNLDRPIMQRDMRRLLLKYHGMPLSDIRAGEVMDSLRPIIYRHRLRLPANFWLLAKTLVMMEGVGLELDPEFDIFKVSEPYVRKFIMRMWLPSSWGPSLTHSATGWADLLNSLPRQTTRLLGQIERGDLELQIGIPDFDHYVNRLDKITTRIVLSVLMAAIIVALAQLIPGLNLTWPWNFFTWVVVATFSIMMLLGVWLIVSILRSGGKL
jgi:ubiquinone biosynthesis protein